jgi:DNA-directed RNA polymerase subunit H (RpoH/RPB5)
MSINSTRIINIYKSRNVILEQMKLQGYNVEDYLKFSVNEVDAMLSNSQLDMLLVNEDGRKAYIKYYFTLKQTTKQIKKEILDNVIEDLFVIDDVLTKKDTLIVIIDDEPNDTILARIRYLYEHDGIFVIIHNIHRLQSNILDHVLVPFMKVLDDTEETEFIQKYQIKYKNQLPEISRFDPQALVVGVRPGQICRIQRPSTTAVLSNYYRVCV